MFFTFLLRNSSFLKNKKIERLAGGVHCLRDIVLIVISVSVISTHLASGDDVDTVLVSFVQETEIRILFKFKEEYLFSVLIIRAVKKSYAFEFRQFRAVTSSVDFSVAISLIGSLHQIVWGCR